jgi:hypothetical protein
VEQPVAMAIRAGDPALYIASKTGTVHAIRAGTFDRTPVLDLSGQVSDGSEQGLLGLAFSPDGRFAYINYTDRAGDTNIVSTIISLGQSLRLKVVAEGVETERQAEVLRRLGCDQAQGFLFGPPMPAERLEALLERAAA